MELVGRAGGRRCFRSLLKRTRRLAAPLVWLLGVGLAAGQVYKQPTVLTTNSWPKQFFAGDIAGDSRTDFAYSSASPLTTVLCSPRMTQTVTTYTENGMVQGSHGTFTALVTPFTKVISTTVQMAAARFLQGSSNDLLFAYTQPSVCGSSDRMIQIGLGAAQGNGAFGTLRSVASFVSQGALAPAIGMAIAGDFNGDGRPDLAVVDTANNYLYIVLNPAGITATGGTMAVLPALPLAAAPAMVMVQDVNGDGRPDVVLYVPQQRSVTVLPGRGDGTFAPAITVSLPGGVFSVLAGDITGDGVPDLVVEGAKGALSVFPGGAGLATESPQPLLCPNGAPLNAGQLVAIAPVKPGGAVDILTATGAGVNVLAAQGGFIYSAGVRYNAGPGRSTFAVADFNGDGNLDLALDSPEGIALLYGDGAGGFSTSASEDLGTPVFGLAMGQFTQSGYLDVVTATGVPQLTLMQGDGAGHFAAKAATPLGAASTNAAGTVWSHVVTGDFDGDGKLDAAVSLDGPVETVLGPCCNYSASQNGMSLFFGDGNGGFTAPVPEGDQNTGPHYGMLQAADLNGNGVSDLLNYDFQDVGGYARSAYARYGMPMLQQFGLGNGDGYLRPYQQVTAGHFKTAHTGASDVVVESSTGTGTFQIQSYGNDGKGGFTPGSDVFAPPSQPAATQPGSSVLPASGVYATQMLLADVDGDGNADLLVLYHNLAANPAAPTSATPNTLAIYWGDGDGTFNVSQVYLTLTRNYYQMVVADMNGDGHPDVVLSDGYLVSVLYGQGGRVLSSDVVHPTHFLAGMGINGLAAVDLYGNGTMDLIVANGGAALSNGVVNHGALGINPDVNTGGLTVLTNPAPQTSNVVTGTVVASPEPSIYAQPFTLTATLVQPAGQVAATGMVTFSIDGTMVGMGTLTNGVASFPLTSATILANTTAPAIFYDGVHTLTAAYSGDTNYSAVNLTGSHTVQGQPTTSQFTNLDQTIYYGQEIGYDYGIDAIFGAEASDPTESYGANGLDGGIIEVFVNNTVACSDIFGMGGRCPDAPFEGFSVGTYSTYVYYEGNQYFAPSTSVVYPVTVIPDYTGTTVVSSANPTVEFQPLYLTATVTAFYQPIDPTATTPIPVGTVQFFDGATPIGSGTLGAQGTATVSVATLLVGTHSITACYVVSLNFRPSCSPALTEVVTLPAAPEGTVTLLTSSVNPSVAGQAVTFAAVVETTGAIVQTPLGTVNFYDGTSLLGTATLDKTGRATFTTATLALGVHPITAMYSGSALTGASTSAVLQQLVLVSLPPATGYLLVVDPTSISVGVGNSVTVNVSILVGSNPAGLPFLLGCSQLPKEATCAFGKNSLPAGGGATTLTIGAAAPHTCGTTAPYFVASSKRRGLPWLASAGLALLFLRRRRLRGVLLGLVVIVSLGTLSVTGCGGPCTDLGTQPFDYSFQVTATEQGAPAGTAYATETQAIKMHVHL